MKTRKTTKEDVQKEISIIMDIVENTVYMINETKSNDKYILLDLYLEGRKNGYLKANRKSYNKAIEILKQDGIIL